MYDYLIIGAGVVGASVARALARFDVSVGVMEAKSDVAMGASGANSGILHAGYDCEPDSLMARLNVEGNRLYDTWAAELEVPFRKEGTLVVAFSAADEEHLKELKSRGETNGVPNLRIISGEEAHALEPNLSDSVTAALFAPSGGIINPYEFNIACMENARANGVQFFFNARVERIAFNKIFTVTDYNGAEYLAKSVINCAGVGADNIARKIGDISFNIMPRRGEYMLYDKCAPVSRPIFQTPSKMGKGVLVAPTVDGNFFIGPTSVNTADRWDKSVSVTAYQELRSKADLSVKNIPYHTQITSFAGLRAVAEQGDFIIGRSGKNDNFINAAGICSPGLTAAPAIAEYIVSLLGLKKPKPDYSPTRKRIRKFLTASLAQKKELIAENPLYGRIICRCESVTEAEIVEAIKRGATTLDAIKRRTRSGMGRCQGGFCTSKILEILARELGMSVEDITKFGGNSQIVLGDVKEVSYEG